MSSLILTLLGLGCAGGPPAPPGDDGAATTEEEIPPADSALLGDSGAPFPAWQPPEPLATLAIIGDYGVDDDNEAAVAALVASWDPAHVLTLGDNNYVYGAADTIDDNIGKHYAAFIHPYVGAYGPGAEDNRFWPCPGNHDWNRDDGLDPYTDYFTLPGNERYYDQRLGQVHVFCVDSDRHEPDGVDPDSPQAEWLRGALAASDAPFKLVTMHHPPYSSGVHGSAEPLRWPYAEWGADVVLAGHEHSYERLSRGGLPYVINGLGGVARRPMGGAVEEGSRVFFDGDWGAQRVTVTDRSILLELITLSGGVVDQLHLPASGDLNPTRELVAEDATWRWYAEGEPPEGWDQPGFDDGGWGSGPAPLGYGDEGLATALPEGVVTAYLRHGFTVEDPGAARALTLGVSRDDGALVRLNGVEVWRSNLPWGEVDHDTLAEQPISDADEGRVHEVVLESGLLMEGHNVVAVEVHQASTDSSDLRLGLTLEARWEEALVPSGATWRYQPAGQTGGEGWEDPDYPDAAWAEGPAPLGSGDGIEATSVSGLGPDGELVSRFRHTFTVDEPREDLLLRLVKDDGAVVWLNGVEVWRGNLPQGELEDQAAAIFAVSTEHEAAAVETWVDGGLLRRGDNVLAVEVHQASVESPDLRLDAELIVLR